MSQDLKEEEQEGNICDHDGESTDEIDGNVDKPKNMKPGAVQLRNWLNKTFRIEMTDGRVLIGIFLCTDRDSNIILGSCSEFLPSVEEGVTEEPRMLGLVMVPGRHIISIYLDTNESYMPDLDEPLPLNINVGLDEIM